MARLGFVLAAATLFIGIGASTTAFAGEVTYSSALREAVAQNRIRRGTEIEFESRLVGPSLPTNLTAAPAGDSGFVAPSDSVEGRSLIDIRATEKPKSDR